ncbi:helix-turn-helix transcriptional regulator [Rhodococcus sp. KRD175]|jgi:ribosome-binding protein aMBF1 (putative translation factor)|uniref:helix-turn-helix transcriptional regulator n=1 Tax=Rhodococcus sp. KRD175 TaxID=2729729 RepID=UPI0019D31670|nr:helix-turn-helix transcriptional regulator [Rhodococcus sp. KRD175]
MARRTVPLRPHIQDALSLWGQLIRRGRLDRAWTAKDLAARANISEQTVLSAEAGHRGTAVGTMMDLADLVGIPIFGIDDRSEIAIRRRRGEEMLALLPSRVHKPKMETVDDDF